MAILEFTDIKLVFKLSVVFCLSSGVRQYCG